jgi:hypothetical protein
VHSMSNENLYSTSYRVAAIAAVLLALLLVPAPLLPPHRLAEATQFMFGLSWKVAYFTAAIGLQIVFYGSIGILCAFVVKRGSTVRRGLLQAMFAPVIVVSVAMVIRSLKVGHLPVWINAVIPIAACFLGVWIGLILVYRRWKFILVTVVAVMGLAFWGLRSNTSSELSQATANNLERLVAAGQAIPPGEARFGALVQLAFSPPGGEPGNENGVQHNRAAILALGIALGDEKLAKYAGLDGESKLVHNAALLRTGTTLRDRADWVRHFCVSASLAVLENPLVSDAGGLMKEQLDALARGTGFSFCDFAANRAGVRFAEAATNSAKDAKAMQDLLKNEFITGNILPPIADLPENLTTEQFRDQYGSVGSDPYRRLIFEIETRLNRCAALTPFSSGQGAK